MLINKVKTNIINNNNNNIKIKIKIKNPNNICKM